MPASHQDKRLNCGGCKWLYTGFEGKTCAIKRLVNKTTPACIEYSIYRPSPFLTIEQDKWVREMEVSMQTLDEKFLKAKSKEMDEYKLYKAFSDKDPRSYMDDDTMLLLSHRFELCQSYQERVLDLVNELRDMKSTLWELRKNSCAYLLSNYTEQVRSLKNDSERDAFYTSAMPKLMKAIDRLDRVIEKGESVQGNLKDAHFAMQRTQDGALAIYNARISSLVTSKRSQL
jgi:hypothetical protein